MDKEELRTVLGLGKFCQIGFVVRDISKKMKNYEETIGIGPFMTFDFIPEKSFIRGQPPGMHLKIAIAELSPELGLELIEVVSGKTCHLDFLEKHGDGLQHLGFRTDEYDHVLQRAESLGIEVAFTAETTVAEIGHVRAAYLDTYDLMGTFAEIIEIKPL